VNHDANVQLDGTYLGGTDAKVFSTVSKTLIRDCHGDTMFILRTGNGFKTLINQNNIKVNYEIRTADEATTLAYSEGTHFFTDLITLKAANGSEIAELSRDLGYTWTISVYDQTHPVSDPVVLFSLAGFRSFGEDKDETDLCNEFYQKAFWFVILVGVGALLLLGALVWDWYQQGCERPSMDCLRAYLD